MADIERSLPNSLTAERAVLGGVILNNALISQVIDRLDVADFHALAHQRVYTAQRDLYRNGSVVDEITLQDELEKNGLFDAVGGSRFIADLTFGLPNSANLGHYIEIVKGKAALRSLIKTAAKITDEALEQEDDAQTILDHAQTELLSLSQAAGRRVMSVAQLGAPSRERIEGMMKGMNPGIPTPWVQLDNLCRGGIQETELWGIAALTKHGKSSVMKQWAQMLGSQGRRVLIFTREMSEIKILFRMLAAVTGIPVDHIRYGLDQNRVDRLITATRYVENYPIFFDAFTSNIQDVKARVREMIRLEGIEIVFADYLQLFRSGMKSDNRAAEVGYVWRTMKDTAQDFNTRVVALAQFNREAFKSEKRPYFHQVEGSGEGEKAVDVGMVLVTDLNKGEPGARPATIHIDYQRDAPGGAVDLVFDGRIMEFKALSEDSDFNN